MTRSLGPSDFSCFCDTVHVRGLLIERTRVTQGLIADPQFSDIAVTRDLWKAGNGDGCNRTSGKAKYTIANLFYPPGAG